jgi:hypothetical protein
MELFWETFTGVKVETKTKNTVGGDTYGLNPTIHIN